MYKEVAFKTATLCNIMVAVAVMVTVIAITTMILNCSTGGLTRKMLAFKCFMVANLHYQLRIDNTKLPCYTLPPMQHHSFFRNLPTLSVRSCHLDVTPNSCK